MTSTKNDRQMTLPLPPPTRINNRSIVQNNGIPKHVANFKNPLPTPLLCRYHNGMCLFWLFKVWSVTCLNANEILNFMKIQSSYLLSSYQRNQAS